MYHVRRPTISSSSDGEDRATQPAKSFDLAPYSLGGIANFPWRPCHWSIPVSYGTCLQICDPRENQKSDIFVQLCRKEKRLSQGEDTMPFPDDLSDILPLPPGTGVTRRLFIFGHALFVEVKMRGEGYRLVVYDRYMDETTKCFEADRLGSEEEIELSWQEFLRTGESIFSGHHKLNGTLS
jgi:hypothetical protein